MRKRFLVLGLLMAVCGFGILAATPTLAAVDELTQCKQQATTDYSAELKNIATEQKTAVADAKTAYNNAKKNYNNSLKTEYADYKQGLQDCKTNTSVSACNVNERTTYLQAVKNSKNHLNADYKTYLTAIKQAPIDYRNARKVALDNLNQAKLDCVDQQALIDQVNVDQVDASVPVDTTLPDAFTTPTDTSQQTTRPSTTVAPNSSASTLPAVGWNPVNVNSCTQVNNDILISNAVNNGAPYILSTACRNGGDGGLKFYTMKCLSNTQYRVDWRPCTSQETAAVTNPSQTVATCSETDNGLDYNVFGRTTGNDEVTGVYGTYGDSCGAYVGDSNQSAGAYIAEKHCSSGNGKVYVHTQWYNCPNGCSAGACLAQKPTVAPVATCSETDNGLDYNVFGRTTGNDEVTGVYGTYPDSCGAYVGDSGKDSGAYIAEKHCSSGNGKVYVHTQWYNCENGCSAGACLAQKPVVVPVVTTPAPYTTCSETDNGIDYNVFGKTTGNDENTGIYGTYPDSCGAYVGDSGKDTGAYIAEKHCSSGNGKVYVHTQWYNCANGCSAGACLAQKVATNDSCYSNPLSVALSSASPLSQNLYMGQTNTELVRVKLTNSNCADLRVNEVDTAFSSQNSNPNLLVNNFKLIAADGNIQLGNTLANPGLNNAFYTSFIIPANSSKEISVYSDISLNTTPGWFQTGINALATTNLVTGANSTVNSRIYGNQMTVIAPRN